MKRVMFYVLVSCVLLAGSSCELVSEPDGLIENELHTGGGNAASGSDIDPGPE